MIEQFIVQSFQDLGLKFLFHAPRIIFFYTIFVIWFANKFKWEKGNFLRHIQTLFTIIFLSSAIDFVFINPDPNGYKNIWLTLFDISMTSIFAYLSFFIVASNKPVKKEKNHTNNVLSSLEETVSQSSAELSESEKILKYRERFQSLSRYSSQKVSNIDISGLSLKELILKKQFNIKQIGENYFVYFFNGYVGIQDGLEIKIFRDESTCMNAVDTKHLKKYLPYGAIENILITELIELD